MSLLEIEDLHVTFPLRKGELQAVRGVNLHLETGASLGIVGESGSGKSVCVSTLLGLVPRPPAVVSGKAWFDGVDLCNCPARELRGIRGKRISMIFQDPMTSLNPHMRVVDQIAEPLLIHEGMSKKTARIQAVEMMKSVGIPDAAARARAWPHEFSGGMRQRVMIAMAMISKPELLIADEPTTALDVTVQRQILRLISDLQTQTGMALILISHDLAVVADVCERVAVMRNGEVVEVGQTAEVLRHPQHPYTQGLLTCNPALHEPGSRLTTLEESVGGEVRS
ncbi:MAG: ABC transporter ATP-binding protein [Kiritimatiellae bacterium]|jgi:oligopeptide transport system ATP-binding protein|nr:ABC transporter ATP-binding protein [Kiritimatiellia bacterium]